MVFLFVYFCKGVFELLNDYMKLKQEVSDFMKQGESTEEQFNELALKIFQFQYTYNQPYRKYCQKRRISPKKVVHFTQIPPVPIDAFKLTTLSCYLIEETEAVFMTSGTTRPEQRGKNYHRDLEIYDLSMKTQFKNYVLPDVEQIKMFILFPPKKDLPNSSLAHYLHLAKETFGTSDSQYVFDKEHFQSEKLVKELKQAEMSNEPILLIGATFSFIHFLDECNKEGLTFKLPENSRLMDTGGAKGKSREIDPHIFKQEMSKLFSIPIEKCINMYGMTELSSQCYEQSFWRKHKGLSYSQLMTAPHWMRTRIVNIENMEEKPLGEKGIIVHYDLANLNSVIGILTEDVGIQEKEGFQLLGRANGAEAKGCSLVVEQFIEGDRS